MNDEQIRTSKTSIVILCMLGMLLLFTCACCGLFMMGVNLNPWAVAPVVAPVAPIPDQGLLFVGGVTGPDRRGDIVFIHGLNGDPWTTWGDKDAAFYWPRWLHEQNPDIGVWTVRYDAASSKLKGNPMGIGDRAESILNQMHTKGIGKRPIIIISHSLGGIVAKRMVESSYSGHKELHTDFLNQLKGVVFLSTPHSGSDAGTLAKIVKAYNPTELVPALNSDDDRLRALNTVYKRIVPKRQIANLPFVEKYDVVGVGRVVTERSADPGLDDVEVVPANENHLSISKPDSKEDDVVTNTDLFLKKYLLPQPVPVDDSIESFLRAYDEAKQAGNFQRLRDRFLGRQFTWDAFVAVSTPQDDSDPDSIPVYSLSFEAEAAKRKHVIGASFPRYSGTFKDLRSGSKVTIRGVYSDKTSDSRIRIKECELIKYDEGDAK